MSDRSLTLAGRVVATVSVIAGILGIAIVVRLGGPAVGAAVILGMLAIGVGSLAWVTVGAQPRNGAVWALVAAALFAAIAASSSVAFTVVAPESIRQLSEPEFFALSPADLPTDVAIAINPFLWAWLPAIALILTVFLLLFPNGKPPSPRWRWLVWFSLGTIALGMAGSAWNALPSSTLAYDTSANDLSDTAITVIGVVYTVWLLAILVAVVGSIASLVVRYRRSSGDTRHQIRWVLWAGAIFAAVMFLTILDQEGEVVNLDELVVVLITAAGLLVLIVSFGVAITRYRLYDIDIVISRTVTYGALAIFTTATYVAIVVGVGAVVGAGDEPSLALAIGATAIVALLFQPVRSRVQHWANRLVYGKRTTPYETLARFSKRAAEAETDDEVLERIPRLIVDGTGATQATLLTTRNDELRPTSWWPEDIIPPALADYSVPVVHQGELLGGLSLSAGRGETISHAEQELVQNLADSLGLALRNARLTADLRDQVHELAASRERILSAADEARRGLEQDLDMGPQQELVAVKVKLGVVKTKARVEHATKTAEVLAQLEADTGTAIESVRDFARGVYPPLLEADGLAVAVSAEGAKSALPVVIAAEGVGRYSREVETAVFFSILESLQNAAKYAEAVSAVVTLVDDGRRLRFSVKDDGQGFDPGTADGGSGIPGIADRLDSAGGTFRIESAPGSGTTVMGSVPI